MSRRRDGYYYSETRSTHSERTSKGVWPVIVRVLDVVWMVLTVASAILLIMGMLSGVVSPVKTSVFAIAGLFYPIIYLLNVACALWWAVRLRWWFFVPALLLIVGIGNIGRYHRMNILKGGDDVTKEQSDLVVVSYNVKTFSAVEELTTREEADSVMQWVASRRANLVCLQEAYFSSHMSLDYFRDSLSKFKYSFFENIDVNDADPETGTGLMVMSSYPIVDHGVAWADSVRVGAVWADVKLGRDTVRVFNLHLQSTGISPDDDTKPLSAKVADDTLSGKKLSKIVERISQNYRVRATEAEGVARHIEESAYPVLVCGDMNDVPTSYTYSQIRTDGLQDAFVERGSGAGYTFKGFRELFRIDYILSSDAYFEVKEYDSPNLPYSDHNPIVARIGIDAK